jgi:hypothetical protein
MLQQFVVTANVANGATSIPIYPAIIGPNAVTGAAVQYQTVAAAPANGAAISLVNQASEQYRKNVAYAPGAITMVTADLIMPKKVEEAARERFDGLSMRMITAYLPGTDQLVTRLDILFGYLFIRPEWCVAIPDTLSGPRERRPAWPKREHPRYENTEWDEYEFREYPMMLYPGSNDGGKTPTVTRGCRGSSCRRAPWSAQRGRAPRGAGPGPGGGQQEAWRRSRVLIDAPPRGASGVKPPDADERLELLERAEVKGIKVDKTWSIARIQDAIDTFKANPI